MSSGSPLVKKYQELISEAIYARKRLMQIMSIWSIKKRVPFGSVQADPRLGALAQELGRTIGVLKKLNAKVSLGGVESDQDTANILLARRLIDGAKRFSFTIDSVTKHCTIFYSRSTAKPIAKPADKFTAKPTNPHEPSI